MSKERTTSAWRIMGAAAATFIFYGCTAGPDSSPTVRVPISRPSAIPEARLETGVQPPPGRSLVDAAGTEPVTTAIDARPAALVDGQGVVWGALRPILIERAGAEAVREIVLERRLEALVAEHGLEVDGRAEHAEEQLLLSTLSDDPDVAYRLLSVLRDTERLGVYRYPHLLRRNAMLRALVRDRVHISGTDIEAAHDVTHGAKRQARLLTTPDLQSAHAALARLNNGARFGDVAVEVSTDSSAARGGLLQPISRLDPSYPAAIRQAVWSLPRPGARSSPILLDQGYAIVELERELPPTGVALIDVTDDMERLARLRRERELMDDLARQLVANAKVVIFDQHLNDSWGRAAAN